MPPELKDSVGKIACAGCLVIVINMGKYGVALNGDIIRCVGHNETVTRVIGNRDQKITIYNKGLPIYYQEPDGVDGQVVDRSRYIQYRIKRRIINHRMIR